MRTLIHIAVLTWATAWFVGIVPAHQRGRVTVPGESPDTAAAVDACCSSTCDDPASQDGDSKDPVRQCAVCHIVAKLDIPPTLDLFTPRLGLIDVLPPAAIASLFDRDAPRVVDGRAPPSC